MARNIKRIAEIMGAEIVGRVPDVGGGAFGAARIAAILKARLEPSRGRRPGRPAESNWKVRSKVPMSIETKQKLEALAEQMSGPDRKVSGMQVAAQLLEEAVERCAPKKSSDASAKRR